MCYIDCFLIYFTIRAGTTCVSSILLAFGVVGVIAVPLLPYSSNELQFFLIMGYMLLLVAAFTTALCGSLTDSKRTVMLGLILGIMAFFVWMMLTIPSLMSFGKMTNNNFCLGPNCGETHWLVPRNWKDTEISDAKLVKENENSDYLMESKLNEDTNTYTDQDHISVDARHSTQDENVLPNDAMSEHMHLKEGESESDTKEFTEPAAHLDEYDIRDLAKHIMSKGYRNCDVHTLTKRFVDKIVQQYLDLLPFTNDSVVLFQLGKEANLEGEDFSERARPLNLPKYMEQGRSLVRLTRPFSIFLATVYALLFAFALATIFMFLGSFACREGVLEECGGFCPVEDKC